jgi:hypothetical protein
VRRAICLAASLTLLAAGISTLPAGAADPVELLPDLVADPVTGPRLEEYVSGGSFRRLLRFTGYVHNAGQGAAAVRASGRLADVMGTKEQLVDQTGSSPVARGMPPATQVLWEPQDSHLHWHLRSAARYSLWDPHSAAKVGFCLMDIDPVGDTPFASRRFDEECEKFNSTAAEVTMGVAAGWRDVYTSGTAFQWVDVSDVAPGDYLIRSEVDPEDVIDESDEANPPANVPFTIPGWVAQPSSAIAIDGRPVSVTPRADAVGAPGAGAQFRVADPPAHGTLSVAPGDWFTGAVTYTPGPGWPGTDSFTVSAREVGMSFPRSPARATVTIGSGTGHRLAISGAPATVRTRSVTRLSATIARGTDPAEPGAVSWSADHGTITSDGVFTAPRRVPAGRVATVRATTPSGLSAAVRMTVKARRAAQASPSPGRGTGVLRLGARRAGGHVVAGVTPRRAGRLRLTVRARGRRVSGCRRRVAAGVTYVCRLRAPRGGRAAVVVASLRTRRGRLLGQRLRLPARKAHAAGAHTHGS